MNCEIQLRIYFETHKIYILMKHLPFSFFSSLCFNCSIVNDFAFSFAQTRKNFPRERMYRMYRMYHTQLCVYKILLERIHTDVFVRNVCLHALIHVCVNLNLYPKWMLCVCFNVVVCFLFFPSSSLLFSSISLRTIAINMTNFVFGQKPSRR